MTLHERLDDVGWSPKGLDNFQEYTSLVFKWMQQATAEIERLQNEVDSLNPVLGTRTEGLA